MILIPLDQVKSRMRSRQIGMLTSACEWQKCQLCNASPEIIKDSTFLNVYTAVHIMKD